MLRTERPTAWVREGSERVSIGNGDDDAGENVRDTDYGNMHIPYSS